MHKQNTAAGLGGPAAGNSGGTLPGGCVPRAHYKPTCPILSTLDLAGVALDRAGLALDLGNLDAARRALAIAGAALQNGAGEIFQEARRRYLLTQSRLYELAHGGDNG